MTNIHEMLLELLPHCVIDASVVGAIHVVERQVCRSMSGSSRTHVADLTGRAVPACVTQKRPSSDDHCEDGDGLPVLGRCTQHGPGVGEGWAGLARA
jgi:hypothetical protein